MSFKERLEKLVDQRLEASIVRIHSYDDITFLEGH